MITIFQNQQHSYDGRGRSLFIHPPAIILLVLLASIASPNTSRTEEIPRLILAKAVELALQNNSDLKTTRQQVESAETTVQQKKAVYFPNLEYSMKGTRVHNDTATDGTSYTTATSSLSSSVNIFNGFSDQAAVESAGFSLSAEKHNLNRVQQSTVYQTISTFIAAVTNQELITVGEENLQDNRRQLARILAFYKAGKRPVTDLYQQQAETSQAELSLLSDERDLQTSKLEVLQTIGISSTERFRIVAPDIPEPSALKADLPAQDILATALATRTDLQSQEHRIKAAGEDINSTFRVAVTH